MADLVHGEGYRWSPSVLTAVAASAGKRVTEAMVLREARALDNGDRYLNRGELSAGASAAKHKLAHPPAVASPEGHLPMSAATSTQHQVMKTALRQALSNPGNPAAAP